MPEKKKGVTLQRSILELNGIVCSEVQKNLNKKKSICVSRSFGEKLTDYENIRSALVVYVQKASFKMREYNFFCRSVTVFLKTSKYEKKKYTNIKTYFLLEATNDTRTIWNISEKLLKKIYLKNFLYNKVGIILSDFCGTKNMQKSFIHDSVCSEYNKKENNIKLMKIMDEINRKFGEGKLRLSSDKNGSFYLKKKKYKMVNEIRI